MTTIAREHVRLELRHATGRRNRDSTPEVEFRTYSGTLSSDTAARTLDLLDQSGDKTGAFRTCFPSDSPTPPTPGPRLIVASRGW